MAYNAHSPASIAVKVLQRIPMLDSGAGNSRKNLVNWVERESMKQVKEVLNLIEAAEFLGLDRRTLRDAVARGEVPCGRVGRRYIFIRDARINWASQR